MLMSSPNSYKQLLYEPSLEKIASNIGPRLQDFLFQVRKIFLEQISLNRIENVYQLLLKKQIQKFTYLKILQQGPFCSKRIKQYYRCFTCQEFVGIKVTTSVCRQCFNQGDHPGHNFRYFTSESQMAVCDCGDESVLDSRFFCRKHLGESKFIQTKIDKYVYFIKEIQFILYLYFKLQVISENMYDQNKKKQIFGIIILEFIHNFFDKSYANQTIFSELLKSTYLFNYPFVSQDQKRQSILQILFQSYNSVAFSKKLISLLLQSYSNKNVRQIVLIQYFHFKSSVTFNPALNQSINSLNFQYMNASYQIIELSEQNKLKPLVLKYKFLKFNQKFKSFLRLYNDYQIILKSKNPSKTITSILKQYNVSQLSNFCIIKEEKLHKKEVLMLELIYFKVIGGAMKHIAKCSQKEQILRKIIRQTYVEIKKKKQSLSFSLQITFAIAMFAYLNCQLQNLYDLQELDLLELLGQEYNEQFTEQIYVLIKKALYITKIDNFTQYKRLILNDEYQLLGFSKVIPSIDHIYLRILLMIVIRFERPLYGNTFSPISNFIKPRLKAANSLYEFFQQHEMSKAQETMNIMFYEIFLMLNNFLFLSQSSICETIVSQYIGFSSEEKGFDVYRLLVYINPQKNMKEFKEIAEKYLNNPKLIEKFIKEDFTTYKNKIIIGQTPQNMFNLSYNSFYVSPGTFKECSPLYFLKLTRARQTELSSFLFPEQTIKLVIEIAQQFFNTYKQSFQQNEVISTINVVVVALETLVVLYLQTRSQELRTVIYRAIQRPILGSQATEQYRQVVNLFLQNEKKLIDFKQKDRQKADEQENKEQKQNLRKKRSQKMQKIKTKQSQILIKFSASELPSSQNFQEKQGEKVCLICKGNQKQGFLYYMCNFRHSNLMSCNLGQQNYPVMLISTCGHLIHQRCFERQYFRKQHRHQWRCSLCKSVSNLIVSTKSYNQDEHQEELSSHLIVHLEAFTEQYSEDYPAIEKLLSKFPELKCFQSALLTSITYQIFGYSLQFTKYFFQKILPILKIIIVYLKEISKVSKLTLQIWKEVDCHFEKSKHNYKFFKAIYTTIFSYINGECEQGALYSQEMADRLKSMQANPRKTILEEKHLNIAMMILDYLTEKNDYFLSYFHSSINKRLSQEHKNMYKLPQKLEQLNKEIGQCPKCMKRTSKILICMLCARRICQNCKQEYKNHVIDHLGSTIYIRAERGECLYIYGRDKLSTGFLYEDYVGDEVKSDTICPEKDKYFLSKDKKNRVLQDILQDNIEFRTEQNLMRRIDCEVQ